MEMGSMKLMMATEDADKQRLTMASSVVEWMKMQQQQQNHRDDVSVCDVIKSKLNGSSSSNSNNCPQKRRRKQQQQQQRALVVVPVDAPMDLSKRSSSSSSPANVVMNDRGHAEDADDDDDDDGDFDDQPLNLSVNGHHSTSSWTSNFGTATGTAGVAVSPSERVQSKRVRLEEMVSYIRRCSANYPDDEEDKHLTDVVNDDDGNDHARPRSDGQMQHDQHHHRRKPTAPYKGSSFKKPKKTLSKDQLMCVHSSLDSTNPMNSSNAVTAPYPVLRQQLLAVDTPTTKNTKDHDHQDVGDDGDDDDELDQEEEEEEEELDEIVKDDDRDDHQRMNRAHHHHHHHQDSDVDVLRQLRLLSSAAPMNGLQWSAYAYYANLLQELQGTLSNSTGAGVADQNQATGGLHSTMLPLPLPLMPQSPSAHSTLSGADNGSGGVATLSDCGTAAMDASGAAAAAAASAAACRKRAPRALTGKHVKHGTGASPATLLTLRQKIEQRKMCQQQVAVDNMHSNNHHHHHHHHHHQKNGGKADRKSSKVSTPRKKVA